MKTATKTSVPSVAPATATNPHVRLLDCVIIARLKQPASVTIVLDIGGQHQTRQKVVKGSVNAIAEAVKELTEHDAEFEDYHVNKIGKGSSAIAHVRVDYNFNGIPIHGDGEDEDTLFASAIAMINAVNQMFCAGTAPAH